MISSYSDELTLSDQDAGVITHNDDLLNAGSDTNNYGDGIRARSLANLAHTIHLSIKDTTFKSENADTSIIVSYGARLQSSGCTFVNNTDESIIRSEFATVAMTSTEFNDNEIKDEDGVVVLDVDSALEQNEGNCEADVLTSDAAGDSTATSANDTLSDTANSSLL